MVRENLERIRKTLPSGVALLAVSKFHPVEAIREAYDAGQRAFGESRAMELRDKAAELPDDIRWHFIGHLQTNKVRPVVKAATVIESIDSERLLRLVDAEAKKAGKRVEVFIQLHVAREETKFGLTPDEALALFTPELVDSLEATTVIGVMGMASNTDDEARVEADFAKIRESFDRLKAGTFAPHPEFREVSMGMSDDYLLAVKHGSTMVRIGTDIFGNREY